MQFKALFAAVLFLGSVSAQAGDGFVEPSCLNAPMYIETYCFKLPAQLKGGVTKVRATFLVDVNGRTKQTREVISLEVLGSGILAGAEGANYASNPNGDRRKLIGGKLLLEDGVIVSGRYMVTGATFMASVRDLSDDRYAYWHNRDTAAWSGVHPERPHLRFEDGETLLADVIGKKCR